MRSSTPLISSKVRRCSGRGVCNLRHGFEMVLLSAPIFLLVDGGVSILSESISILSLCPAVRRCGDFSGEESLKSTILGPVTDFGDFGSAATGWLRM